MINSESILKGKNILAVDDEGDVLETIVDILDEAKVDLASDYKTASKKIKENRYDLAILDIMGVDGFRLLDESVDRGIPTVMLTAHAMNPETLKKSICKGAIAYLPKETLSELNKLLSDLLSAHEQGKPPWKLLFDELGNYFDQHFGLNWKEKDKDFWSGFSRNYLISKGIQKRLMKDKNILDKGI
jgi:DNA-binding response OmpR family regulator